MALSEGDFVAIGAFCYTVSVFPFSPCRSNFPTNKFFLFLQIRFVGGYFLSSQRYDSLFFQLLEINNRLKPPWIQNYINPLSVILLLLPFPDSIRRKSVISMSDNIRKSVQNLNLGIDDAPIALPPEIVNRAASINRFSLVVSTVNPKKQNLRALIGQMPRVWGLADSCVGRILSPGKVQFKFRNEESMNLVLHRGPWSFNDWMLTVHRWYPNITEEEMKIIPFWVRIHGIPTLYLTNAMARFVGSRIGPVSEVDFDENVNNNGFVRVQMEWNCDNPLRFQRNFQFTVGENTLISLHFERLRNFCSKCGSLKHDMKECPLTFDGNEDDGGDDHHGDNDSDSDNGDDDNGPEEEMSEANTLETIDPVQLIPGLLPPHPIPVPSDTNPDTSVSSCPSAFEDTDLTAERLRYLHARFVRETLLLPDTSEDNSMADVGSTTQSVKRNRDEIEVMYRRAEEAEDLAVLSHLRNCAKKIKSEAASSTLSGGAGGPVPPWDPI